MERWLKILLGTFFGSVAVFIFYLIFEKFVKSHRGSNRREKEETERISLRVKQKLLGGEGDEMEDLVYEEYDTEHHEILAICVENGSVSVGVSLFLSDREVEYYWERFPQCCINHTKEEDVPVRSFITAVTVWGEKWTLAECVNILSQDEMVVRNISKKDTTLWRKANQLETKHDFKLYTQWTDNYVCDEVAAEELWSELVSLAKQLLNTKGEPGLMEETWENFPVSHWRRRRVRPGLEHFHAGVPHPGEVTPPLSSTVLVSNNLVSL